MRASRPARLNSHFCRFFLERVNPSLRRSVMLIPWATANPLNSFLNSGLTLKLSEIPFSSCRSPRSEEHTSELQSLIRISYAVFCLKKKKHNHQSYHTIL